MLSVRLFEKAKNSPGEEAFSNGEFCFDGSGINIQASVWSSTTIPSEKFKK